MGNISGCFSQRWLCREKSIPWVFSPASKLYSVLIQPCKTRRVFASPLARVSGCWDFLEPAVIGARERVLLITDHLCRLRRSRQEKRHISCPWLRSWFSSSGICVQDSREKRLWDNVSEKRCCSWRRASAAVLASCACGWLMKFYK